MATNHGAHQTAEARVVSMTEDFCKSPVAPVGYFIWQTLDVAVRQALSVHGLGTPVLNMSSRIATVRGNEAGTGGGVVSGVNLGMCKPVKQYAATVRAEKQCLLTHMTIMEMNTAGPEGAGNTMGKIVYMTASSASSGSYNESDLSSPPAACQQKMKSTGGNWKKIGNQPIRDATLPDGRKIPIFEGEWEGGDSGPNAQYQSAEGRIVINRLRTGALRDASLAHETQHAADDARNGTLGDNILLDENGKKLNRAEAEARARQAGAAELKDFIQGCVWYKRLFYMFGDCGTVPNLERELRRNQQAADAYKKAGEAIEKGDYQAAWKIAEQNPYMCDDIASAIEEAKNTVP